jgi:N-acetylmuramoyl-L-alanine amidase
MSRLSRHLPLLTVLALGLVSLSIWILQDRNQAPAPPSGIESPTPRAPKFSDLAPAPDWTELDAWQGTVTRSEFIEMMDNVFTVSPEWREWFVVKDELVEIDTGEQDSPYVLRLASSGKTSTGPRYWRPASELSPAPAGRPLDGLKITIDPGHIGGKWAKIEERWFQVGAEKPVREGDMTLQVARILKPKLESLGAEVSLVRTENEPVTTYRPESLMQQAREIDSESPQGLAERLFYRTAEIRARADLVNQTLKPDIVLCLHFNAEAWGDPLDPRLVPNHHFHLILNGAYMDGEVALADQRFEILRKIVERIHPEEAALAASVAASFVESTQMPPYLYEANSRRAVNIDANPYLWARNLLANRLYRCPVVFLEPYVMNSVADHARIQLGDYEGIKEIDGKPYPSIFREYAESVTNGLANYYRSQRTK